MPIMVCIYKNTASDLEIISLLFILAIVIMSYTSIEIETWHMQGVKPKLFRARVLTVADLMVSLPSGSLPLTAQTVMKHDSYFSCIMLSSFKSYFWAAKKIYIMRFGVNPTVSVLTDCDKQCFKSAVCLMLLIKILLDQLCRFPCLQTCFFISACFCFRFFFCCVIWASPTDCSLQSLIFRLSHLPRICQSCWRWCVSPSSTRPTCWTWWTTRSWSSRRRRAAIWWTRPSATTCCPTRGKRCRRPGLGRGSLPVNTTHTQQLKINLMCIVFGLDDPRAQWSAHLPMYLTKNNIYGIHAPTHTSTIHTWLSATRKRRRGDVFTRRPWPATELYWF